MSLDFAQLLNNRLQVVVLDGYLIKIQQAGRNMHNGGCRRRLMIYIGVRKGVMSVKIGRRERSSMSTTITQQASQPELLQYLAVERVSRQWSGFLSIFSGELAAQLTDAEYRELLTRMGGKFAALNPLPACAELSDIQAAANAFWAGMQWGYVQFADQGQNLQIVHHACPLPAGLQLDADVAGGFLQGVYLTWIRAAGAPVSLSLHQLPAGGQPMQMIFELSGS